jgi:hypothetical protein
MRKFAIIVCAICTSVAMAQPSEQLLDAIEQVESGGRGANTPDGDGGKAIGPFQIHRAYWRDAVEFDRTIGGKYEDCRKPEYARRVVRAYLTRYGKGKSNESLARMHNGGCGILKRKETEAWHRTTQYWRKVKEAMQ